MPSKDNSGRDLRITKQNLKRIELGPDLKYQQAALEGADMLVISTDHEGVIRFANEMAQKQLGYSAKELIGKATPLLFKPSNIVCINQNGSVEKFPGISPSTQGLIIEAIMQIPEHLFCTLFRKDGSSFFAKTSIFSLKGSWGKTTGYLAIIQDVLEVDRTEKRGLIHELHLLGLLKLNQMSESSVEELVHFSMDEGIRLARSRFGFIQFLEDPASFFLFKANSSGGVEPERTTTATQFRSAISEIISEAIARKVRVLFGEVPFSPQDAKGISESEINLTNGFCTPIFFKETIFCVAGVADRDGRFEEAEIQKFTLLLDNMARLVYLRQAELEREHLRKALAKARAQEMSIGSQIQQILLMGKPPQGMKGVEFGAITIPSLGIDGDFFDFFTLSESCFDVLVGDVMGKGVPAALMGAAVKSHFQRALSSLLIHSPKYSFPTPEDIVAMVHSEITPQLSSLESFVSLHFARFDLKLRTLALINCGHTMLVHFHQNTKKAVLIPVAHPPLGVKEGETYRQILIAFEPGDVFLSYSDGVTEARNSSGQFFGTDSLLKFVEECHSQKPQELIDTIVKAVIAFSGSKTFHDDLTLVVISIDR